MIPYPLLATLALLSATAPFATDMYLPVMPEIVAELGTTRSMVQLTISGFFIGMGVGQLVMGPLSDAIGRKRLLIAGAALALAASVLAAMAPTATVLVAARVLQGLGGGACTLARYFAHVWPGSRNTVVELDAELALMARSLFDVPRAPSVKIRVGDAREATNSFKPATRDVIIRDVFSSATTPRDLTTVEFYAAARESLREGGLYIANCGAHADLKEAKEELAGMNEVWPHIAVVADPPMLKGRRYGNIVLIAANQPLLATAELTRGLLTGAVPAQFKDATWARRLATTPRHDPAPSVDAGQETP